MDLLFSWWTKDDIFDVPNLFEFHVVAWHIWLEKLCPSKVLGGFRETVLVLLRGTRREGREGRRKRRSQ